jgi:hypothetical protein
MSEETQKSIIKECEFIKNFLIDKNKKYGDSAINPIRFFSKSDTLEQINVRLDDKLSRILKGDKTIEDEDVEIDIIGYLILKRICKNNE